MVSKPEKNFFLPDYTLSSQYRAPVMPKMSFLWDAKVEKRGGKKIINSFLRYIYSW